MTFDEFKTEFLSTVHLDEYKKQDSYIHKMWEEGKIAAIATNIKGKTSFCFEQFNNTRHYTRRIQRIESINFEMCKRR